MSLIQNVPGAVYRTLHDARRTLVFVTQQIRAMTGHDATVLATGAHGLSDLVHPDDLPAVAAALAGAAPGRPVAAEYRLRHADGGVRWVQDSAQLVTGGGRTYLDGVLMDVSGRRQAHEELAWMALHDPLTRLPNRRALDERLLAERTRREREGGALSAVVLDVDHFKNINDRHGHDAGDRALVGVAERLSARAPARGMVARIGGEEFVMLLPGLALPEAVAVAEGVRAHVAAAPIAGLSVTVSAGVAEATGAGDGLLRAADAALYRAKREGRDRVAAATA